MLALFLVTLAATEWVGELQALPLGRGCTPWNVRVLFSLPELWRNWVRSFIPWPGRSRCFASHPSWAPLSGDVSCAPSGSGIPLSAGRLALLAPVISSCPCGIVPADVQGYLSYFCAWCFVRPESFSDRLARLLRDSAPGVPCRGRAPVLAVLSPALQHDGRCLLAHAVRLVNHYFWPISRAHVDVFSLGPIMAAGGVVP